MHWYPLVPWRQHPRWRYALDVRKTFVDGYVQRALQHGDSPAAARTDANCMFDVLQARLTAAEWTELVQQAADKRLSQAWMARLAPEFVACAHLGRPPAAPVAAGDSDAAQLPLDGVDSSRVAHVLRRLRVAKEARLQQVSGHPVILATGRCTADIMLDAAGQPREDFSVSCSDPQLQSDMRQAVVAVLPLRDVGPGSVQLRVSANDAQPMD